ncbi:serine protease [Candidatus Uhrbacteria bacterium]|nr:serine protease [Candidatus Uhrbacteria bacterium]
MKLFLRRNFVLGAVIILVSLLSAAISALIVGSSIDRYSDSLERLGVDVAAVNSVKPPVVPGTIQEALTQVRERAAQSSLAIVNIVDPVHRDGIVASRIVGTATALTTDGWVMLPDSVVKLYGKNTRIVFDSVAYQVDTLVEDPATEYSFAKTKIASARVGTFGSSDTVASGDLVFVVSGDAIYPRTIISEMHYEDETNTLSSDVLSRLFSIDQDVSVSPGAMVTNAAGELIGVMADTQTIRPLTHITSALEDVLQNEEIHRTKLGVLYRDIVRIVDEDENFREGLRIVSVDRQSPADKAGIKVDDVILRVQGLPVDTKPLSEYVVLGKVGERIQLQVQRGETEIEIFVTLE